MRGDALRHYMETLEHERNLWKEDPFAADCIHGGLGCYVLLDSLCEFECPWRESCRKIRRSAEQERKGKIWRRLFKMEDNKL